MKFSYLLLAISMFTATAVAAQDTTVKETKEEAYTRTINARSEKIVTTLNLADQAKAARVKSIIANQYRSLNDIYTARDEQLKTIKVTYAAAKDTLTAKTQALSEAVEKKLAVLHTAYLKQLGADLAGEQVTKVKDGMTYGVLPITYNGYLDMIQTLTEEQKKQIMTWLVEAREHAMDAESSEKKHWWFGKYKGRINNYLSSAGYDLKKEGEAWEKRKAARGK
jgi:hypothetical protein